MTHKRIPTTSPAQTLIDIAARLTPLALERAVSEADQLNRIGWEGLTFELRSRATSTGPISAS